MDKRIRVILNESLGEGIKQRLQTALTRNKTLKYLSLGKQKVSPSVMEGLCSLLEENTELERAGLQHSTFTDDAALRLIHALSNNKSITHLQFNNCKVSDAAVHGFCHLFMENQTLRVLSFPESSFSESGVSQIIQSLLSNTCITILQFGKSTFTDADMLSILYALSTNTNITYLRIHETKLTNAVVPALCQLFTGNCVLQLLSIWTSTFSDQGMCRLLHVLTGNNSIVYFSARAMSDVHLPWMVGILEEHPDARLIKVLEEEGSITMHLRSSTSQQDTRFRYEPVVPRQPTDDGNTREKHLLPYTNSKMTDGQKMKMSLPEEHNSIITQNWVRLVKEIKPEPVLDYLLQENMLTMDGIEEIRLNATRAEQVRRLLSLLMRKSLLDYYKFKEALRHSNQHIAFNLLI